MKKLLSILLCAAMLLALVACGAPAGDQDQGDGQGDDLQLLGPGDGGQQDDGQDEDDAQPGDDGQDDPQGGSQDGGQPNGGEDADPQGGDQPSGGQGDDQPAGGQDGGQGDGNGQDGGQLGDDQPSGGQDGGQPAGGQDGGQQDGGQGGGGQQSGGLTSEEAKAIAESLIDQPVSLLYEQIGQPSGSEYAPSCLNPGQGEDGELYYDGFTVYTYREGDSEVVYYVE